MHFCLGKEKEETEEEKEDKKQENRIEVKVKGLGKNREKCRNCLWVGGGERRKNEEAKRKGRRQESG